MSRNLSLLLLLICLAGFTRAQILSNDSLQGFNLQNVVIAAHQKHMNDIELKMYVQRTKREYVARKYNLTHPLPNYKYNSAIVNTAPCVNEDFESFPEGAITTTNNGWIAQEAYPGGHTCPSGPVSMYTNTYAVAVYSTQITDPIGGYIGASPLGGTHLAKINANTSSAAKISQTFPVVASSNPLFTYAYKGVLADHIHDCCDDPYLMFRFYAPSGNIISNLSHTVMMGTQTCVTTSSLNWAASTTSVGFNYTPNWQIFSVNLSAYSNSFVTVEVIASSCIGGAHLGYMYYDATCSSGGIIANSEAFISSAGSYTSCAATSTLTGLPGLTNYSWQGPTASGISGSTSSVITTSVSGTYILTGSIGTLVTTQTLALTVNSPTVPTIIGSTTLCPA